MSRVVKGLWMGLRPAVMPSVVSHVILGMVLALSSHQQDLSVGKFLFVCFMSLCLYAYGMWGNDFQDVRWDKLNRPEAPIASGLVTEKAMKTACFIAGAMGMTLGILLGVGEIVILLLLSANFYNWWHKRWVFPVVFMGACRSLLIASAFLAYGGMWSTMSLCVILGIGFYVSILTYLARTENEDPKRFRLVIILLSSMPILDVLILGGLLGQWLYALASLFCYAVGIFLKKIGVRLS